MTKKKKKEEAAVIEPRTVEEVTKDKGMFAARVSQKEIEGTRGRPAPRTAGIQGVKFDIRPLPNIVQTHITGGMINIDGSIDLGFRMIEYIRFGVTKVCDTEGVVIKTFKHDEDDEDEKPKNIFRTEKVMGRPYEALSLDFVDTELPPDVLDTLFHWIYGLTHLSEEEIEKLDFTIPSLSKE